MFILHLPTANATLKVACKTLNIKTTLNKPEIFFKQHVKTAVKNMVVKTSALKYTTEKLSFYELSKTIRVFESCPTSCSHPESLVLDHFKILKA